MNKTKAVLTVAALLVGLIWAGTIETLPLPNVVQDVSIGIVGVLGLTVGVVARGLAAAMMPLAMVLRLLALPLTFGLIGWLALRELRRARG